LTGDKVFIDFFENPAFGQVISHLGCMRIESIR